MPQSSDSTIVTVDLAPFGMPDRYERLVVETSPVGGFVVACLPFFTYGIQFGDLIAACEPGLMFERVVAQSGLRALRVAFKDTSIADNRHEQVHGKLAASGLPHEFYAPGYVSVLLRGLSDQETALGCLADEIRDGTICWEVDPEAFGLVD